MTISEYAALGVIGRAFFDYRDVSGSSYIKVRFVTPEDHGVVAFKTGDKGLLVKSNVDIDLIHDGYNYKTFTKDTGSRSYFVFHHDERSNRFQVDSASSSELKGKHVDGYFIVKPKSNFIQVADESTGSTVLMEVSV